MTTVQVPRFMRIREINKEFGIGLNTIYDAVRTEDLPAYHPNGRDCTNQKRDCDSTDKHAGGKRRRERAAVQRAPAAPGG